MIVTAAPALADGELTRIENHPSKHGPLVFGAAGAEPQRISQLMWDAELGTLVRKVFLLSEPQLRGLFDLTWQPNNGTLISGPIEGEGRITWRRKGSPVYDSSAIVAVLTGTFRAGHAEGYGELWHRSGTIYRGFWSGGKMSGHGRLQLPGGEEYVGEFLAGKRHGTGILVDQTGTIFEGNFRAGRRDGMVRVFPFDGRSYHSGWRSGSELPASRKNVAGPKGLAHIFPAQATTLPDARLGLSLDQSPPPGYFSDFPPVYASESRGSVLYVFSSNPLLRAVWRGNAPLPVSDGGESSVLTTGDEAIPPSFNMAFENTGVRPLQVVGGYLAVTESVSDLEPAIEIYRDQDCGQTTITKFTFHNYGWSEPIGAFVELDILGRYGQRVVTTISGDVTQGWPRAEVELWQAFVNSGVNLPLLDQQPLRCRGTTMEECLQDLRYTGYFGGIADAITLERNAAVVHLGGRLYYDWYDAAGGQHAKRSDFSIRLKLGQLLSTAECGEGGGGDNPYPYPFMLSLDQSNYRVPFTVNSQVASGEIARWSFQIDADKASRHRFQVVLQLADGREIASRPVDLEYFKPKQIWQY